MGTIHNVGEGCSIHVEIPQNKVCVVGGGTETVKGSEAHLNCPFLNASENEQLPPKNVWLSTRIISK